MKNLKQFMILFSLFIGLVSCGQQVEKTNLKISLGAVTGSVNFPGGLYVFGKSDAGQSFMRQVPPGDELIIELNNATWSFAAIGWDSTTTNYGGNVYCDNLQNKQLTGGDFNIAFTTTKAKCAGFTVPEAITPAGELAPLKLYSCLDVKPHLLIGESVDASMDCQGGGDAGGTGPGGDVSFKVSVYTKTLDGVLGEGLVSDCVALGTASNFRLPTGTPSLKIGYKIRAYSGAACTGTETIYSFDNTIADGAIAYSSLGQSAIDPYNSVNLYLHVDMCTGGQLASTPASPFAATMGSNNDYHTICTPEQFVEIGTNGTSEHTFELAQDLDFTGFNSGGTYSYVAIPFGGEIRGQFKKVKNGNKALFDVVKEPTSGWGTYSGNIIMENFNVSVTAVPGKAYGLFANEIQNYGSLDLEVGNIHIDGLSSLVVSGNTSGYVGAFVGKAEHTGSGRTYIRGVQSLADVSADNTSDYYQYVGGLIGKAIGPPTYNYGIYIEESDVGSLSIPYLSVYDNRQVQITGFKNVGGMFGSVFQAELRGPLSANSKITSYGDTGGLVGSIYIYSQNTNNKFNGIKVGLEYVPASAATFVGGVVGFVSQYASGTTFQVGAAVVDMTVPTSVYPVDGLGGIVGDYYSSGYNGLNIYNSKANVDFQVDGNDQGGLVGSHMVSVVETGFPSTSGGSMTMPAINYSVVQGDIGDGGSIGQRRGGFIGASKDADVYRSISNVSVYGESHIGGIYGSTIDSTIYENYITGLVHSTGTSSASTYVGGVVGELVNSQNQNEIFSSISKVDVDIEYGYADISDCTTAGCGLIVGGLNSNHNSGISFYSIAQGAINDSLGAVSIQNCGDNWGSACSFTNIALATSDSSCSAVAGAPFGMDTATGTYCTPEFEKRWHEYGYNGANVGYEYIAGNQLEPFYISNEAQWNGLSSDSFLMAKSYELTNDISFTGNPVPIGGSQESFSGAIFSGGYKLQGMTLNASAGQTGIISHLKDGAMLGNWGQPLLVENLTINCGSQSNCGFIGNIVPSMYGGGDTQIVTNISNGSVNGTGDCTGGLIGATSASARIESSSYQGDVSGAYGVGGFIGCMSNGSNNSYNSYDIRVDIDESFVDLDSIAGNDYVGGFIGDIPSGGSSQSYLEIRDSYAVFDKNNTNSGDDISITGSYASGLVGRVDLNTNSQFKVSSTYIDTSTAQIPTNFRHIANVWSGSFDGSTDRIEEIGLIWNSTTNSDASFYYDTLATSSSITFVVPSAYDLSQGSQSSDTFSVKGGGGCSDWFLPSSTARVLQLGWEDPNSSSCD